MRTITEVIDYETEAIIKAEEFFTKDIDAIFKQRYKLEEGFQSGKKIWVCPFCRQPIKIKGKRDGNISLHFSHVADNLDCPYKIWRKYTKDQILRMKYNGQKESDKHFYLKNLVAEKISRDSKFSEIKIDERFNGVCKDWRKPDVSAIYSGKKIVFELQLTTTFLSVIAERNMFYEKNETYIIWLFDNRMQNIHNMRFMEKDIFYPNHHNSFFIDKNLDGDNFKLICGYEKPILKNNSIEKIWETKEINFSDLVFSKNYRLYWFDYENELEVVKKQFNDVKIKNFERIWQYSFKEEDRKNAIFMIKSICQIDTSAIKYYELISLLDCLYTIKLKKVIGCKHDKIIQVLHQFIQKDLKSSTHFGEYVLRSISLYGAREQVLQEDKTGKFTDKAKLYKSKNFILCHKYDNILKTLFPELFKIK